MKSKGIFWIIVLFITGIFVGIGFLFFRDEPISFWVAQCMAIASVLFSLFLYKQLIKPYHIILNGMELLKEQDFSTHLRPVNNKEANQLIEIFNRMITQLRHERSTVRAKNHFLDLLINASPQGIIILDLNKRISDINSSGLKLLNIANLSAVKGETLNEASFELAPSLAAMKSGDDMIIRGSGATVYRCIRSSFIDQGFDHPFLLIEELTHELLKIEKSSYERIIRMMSHEVNNSVGAIGSTLNVVAEICRQDEKEEWSEVLPAVEASYDRCGHLAHFISNLAHVVKIPEPVLSEVSLNEQVRAVDALTRIECQQRRIKLTLLLTEQNHIIRADGIQLEQVLVNIIKNAYESIHENGEIRIITQSSPLSIVIEDNGPGITDEVKQKLFTPFYTTKKTGQGIGLMFVRDVLLNHRYKFSLYTEEGWTRFKIFFE
ncbi:ATP-binding protein [Parabacteroides sp. PF5-9]|uniref:sensor histidine kinase n=1 Tax=Parabacteroides sp. PF5-9 TaxID=1742404 RepID=UPI0024763279|nr:ATP-binding protein [Parabacteroides sp. PF5-9]MDH6357961.1 signal transduction histidine kinase [Parabacteroides sp. PF5-9]